MKIKYAVWHYEKVGRKKITHTTTGELEWNGNWDNGDHEGIRKEIYAANPGKHIVGYGPYEEWETFRQQIERDKGVIL